MDANHRNHVVSELSASGRDCDFDCENGIQIDECPPLEQFIVRTRNSVYDLIVTGCSGEVLIRGGLMFPEFRRARVIGATAGSHTAKLLGVYVGLCLELFADGRTVVTSPVVEISRPSVAVSAGTH